MSRRSPTPTRWRRLAAAGTGCLLLAGCGVGMQDLPLGRSADGPAYEVTLQLTNAGGLLIGADVRNGQQVIGRVANLATGTFGANVRLSLAAAAALPDNVDASVELPSALGSPFVRLVVPARPSARILQDGDVISVSHTEIGPQIESALATLGAVLSGSGISQLQTVVVELDKAFGGRSGEIRGLTATTISLLGTATANQQDFEDALDLAARVSGQLAAQQGVVDGYLDALPGAVRVLGEQRDAIAALLDSSAQLAASANAILADSPQGLDALVRDASTVLGSLASFNSEIGSTLTAMNTFLGNFGRAVKGDYLVFNGALDVPGVIDTLLTGGALPAGPATQPPGTLQALLTGGPR
ncbi:MCE family protein [Rhodococcus kronopolitis]|uniref:MCE family protein n=1 Tax=Rhodococcus kronopolitis TaxID=1460226 RepID=A0ABV9FWM9_9NOCA